MPKQSDFGFWPKNDGVRLSGVAKDMVDEVFDQRILNAAIFTQVEDKEMAHTARMVMAALISVRAELKRRMT